MHTGQQFHTRVSRLPMLGIGLSVDRYSPDLLELMRALGDGAVPYGFLEIFKGSQRALADVREAYPTLPLAYHAEGLWVTEPQLPERYPLDEELRTVAGHVAAIDAQWVTHECATKQMAGYSFGTYLPPFFSAASARTTAANVRLVQARLDELLSERTTFAPLFLLETPPLTYFAFGDLDVADFFRLLTTEAPCGIVLDIGHLWTIYRYTGEWKEHSLAAFLDAFLARFPLERVIEIHLAGLAPHSRALLEKTWTARPPERPPAWIDAHESPIPAVLFEMFEQVIAQPRLVNLKAVALEVDNKPVKLILEELEQFVARFAGRLPMSRQAARVAQASPQLSIEEFTEPGVTASDLSAQYEAYVRVVTHPTSQAPITSRSDPEDMARYRERYLPHEILEWGGDLKGMFPQTCRRLEDGGLTPEQFLRFWFREPRAARGIYDFFTLKLERFVSYVQEARPELSELVLQEAAALREGYATACL
jgi:uncharacterized protein (UPF0276 family)